MTKKKLIIFILVFIIVGVGMIWGYSYIKNKNNPNATENQSIFQTFNPFGDSDNRQADFDQNNGETNTQEGVNNQTTSSFTKLTNFAIAGFTKFDKKVEKEDAEGKKVEEIIPSLRYTERATGHIYESDLSGANTIKISNTTIPSVYESIFGNIASTVIYRYLDDNNNIVSYLATMGSDKGEFLSSNITATTISPDETKIFYLIENTKGSTGIIRNLKDSKTSQIFSSSFSEWLPQYISDSKIYITTKPSLSFSGALFSVNTSTGVMTKLLSKIPGLTTLANSDGSLVLYSISSNTGPKLGIFNIKDHSTTDLELYGLPEKCIWSKDSKYLYCAVPSTIIGNQYPDNWYKGLVSFDDYFVKIWVEDNSVSTIANSKNETGIDAINLKLDETNNKLFFMNKKDYTLWSLNVW